MSEKKQLNEEELKKVSGGDKGDCILHENPNEVAFKYNIGDRVEVYISGFHVATESATITDRRIQMKKGGCYNYYFDEYYVVLDEGHPSSEYWVSLTDIENP